MALELERGRGNRNADIAREIDRAVICQRILPAWRPGNHALDRRRTDGAGHREIGLDHRGVRRTRIEIDRRTDIGSQARRDFLGKARDHVDLGAVVEADARPPGADIEAALMSDGETALDRCLFVGLRKAAEAIVADHGRAAGDGDRRGRIGFFLRKGRSRGGRQQQSAAMALLKRMGSLRLNASGPNLPATGTPPWLRVFTPARLFPIAEGSLQHSAALHNRLSPNRDNCAADVAAAQQDCHVCDGRGRPLASANSDDRIDLDCSTARQCRDAHSGARMAASLAEQLFHQLGRTVADLGLFGELGAEFTNTPSLTIRSTRSNPPSAFSICATSINAQRSAALAIGHVAILAEAAGHHRAILEGKLARNVEQPLASTVGT
ncbi:hypothetical protein DdX_20916 [Ditylenchus destructor]|uniref:Uncharacterized protein n=1 Tax=Ditylenchus destructor TaxID=166010 RepID=A0AAD4QVQ9_9BILA|nr:hypothetical protein DdX_20916 [Ditylenchus destructor]